MDRCRAEFALRDLDDLDIDNLAAGRFTKDTIHIAMQRLNKLSTFHLDTLGTDSCLSNTNERLLADELNDMLEAARYLQEHQ